MPLIDPLSRATALFALLLLLSACSEPTFDPATCEDGPRVGDCAPDFVLPAGDGADYRLSDQHGAVVVAVFGEMWCPLCRMLQRDLQDMYAELDPERAVVWAVFDQNATGEPPTAEDAQAYAVEQGLTFPILLDRAGTTSTLYDFGVQRPETVVVDVDGIIVWRKSGRDSDTDDQIKGLVERLLANQAAP